MDDEVNSGFLEGLLEMFAISNIASDKFKLAREFSYQPPYVLDFDIGIVEGVEVVEANHMDPFS